jgi:MinD superfamily P-loop ATPase
MIGVISETGSLAGVIINRDGIGDSAVEDFLSKNGYSILMKIPYQENIAEGLASGELLIDIIPEFEDAFLNLYEMIKDQIHKEIYH